jgi:hypothetical protein
VPFYTVYKITNTLNGKYYIGVHKTDDLDDDYMGSGKMIRRAIAKHGRPAFNKEYLAIFDNSEDMFHLEGELVCESTLNDPFCYNLKEGGFGGWTAINRSEKIAEYRVKAGQGRRGHVASEKARKNTSAGVKKSWDSGERDHVRSMMGTLFAGKQHTEETKRRIGKANSKRQSGEGNSNYGKSWIYHPVEKRSIRVPRDQLENFLEQGWVKGRKMRFD